MLGSMVRWFDGQPWFGVGANWLQYVTSVVAFCGWGLFFHTRWHDRCEHCWRKGVVPVRGSIHLHCKRHALEHGTRH